MIRVLLADDHAVLRAGLRSLLNDQPDLRVVGEAGDGISCVDMATELRPDVIVLDINMPNCNGLEALDKLRETVPDTKVVVLTMHDDPGYLRRVLSSGGAGFLLKQSAADELITALHAVMEGGIYVSPQHAKVLLEDTVAATSPSDNDLAARYGTLSEREAEIFALVAQGHSNREIADSLYISVKTVETYKTRMMRKLGLKSRAALVRMALELDVLK